MITWMQRHKKYLIITIWISTIAFVGAGFVGWGQYSYGDKAGAVAKVGDIEITIGELNKSYSMLYTEYNRIFQGNFDEEKAKQYGLKRQALENLKMQALILNLANSYSLRVSDAELVKELKTKEYFFKDGMFDKETYKEILSRNNTSTKEYEAGLRKEILIRKVINLLPVKINEDEKAVLNTVMNIADKIEYKVLKQKDIQIDKSDDKLKLFWESTKQNYMSEVSYDLTYIKQEKVTKEYDDSKIHEYYVNNKNHFKNKDGKILTEDKAKDAVIVELNKKATKDKALRAYITYKKDKLSDDVEFFKTTISATNNSFGSEVLKKVKKLSKTSPFLKPVEIDGEYYIFKLLSINPSKVKTFDEAKSTLLPLYLENERATKLLELAKSTVDTFKGKKTDFITSKDAVKITDISVLNGNEFLIKLFNTDKKRGFISLKDGDIVLYNILEQKMLNNSNINQDDSILKLKSAMFNEGMIKNLQNKYKTEIFIEGL
jgi:peptidyl-prolyl cis-trans isomerase D